jgi:hypothetical protein
VWSINSQLKCSSIARVREAVCGRGLSWRNTTPCVSIPRHLFWMVGPSQFFSVSQYILHVIVVTYCMNSTISAPFLSQKTLAISFLTDNICLNFFGSFDECVCIHCFDCCLVSTFTNEIQVLSSVTCTCD